MKILLHCTYYPPEFGGLESHVAELARGMVGRGHEVRVVTSRSMDGLPAQEVRDGVHLRRTWFPSRKPWGWALHAVGSLGATLKASRWADVIHAQAFASVVPCSLAARRTGRPLVATFHTSHFLMRARKARWRPVLRRLVRQADHVLAASTEIAQVAMELAPGVAVESLTNGVDTDRFRPVAPALGPAQATRRILVPRRLFAKNGVEYLIRAMPMVVHEVPEAEALLVGDGPERSRLEALAARLGVEGRVRFLGAREHAEMPAVLSSGELAVFPSLMEATSVAALECMACELPVVASRVGGLPEIVDDSVGRLVPPAEPELLARAIIELLQSGTLSDMGRRARERVVEHWSNDRLVDRHLQIYEGLLAGKDGHTKRMDRSR